MASSSFNPIIVQLICDDRLSFLNGYLLSDDVSKRRSFPLINKIGFSEFCDIVYNCFGVSKQAFNLQLYLWYQYKGQLFKNLITDDNTLGIIYLLGEAQFEVKFEPIQQPTFTNQLLNQGLFQPLNDENGSEDDEDVSEDNRPLDDSDDELLESSDDTIEAYIVDEDISGDEENEEVTHEQGPLEQRQQSNFEADDDNLIPFNEVDEDIVYWSGEINEIQKGMFFRSKAELMHAVRLWNIRENRELIVQDTRPHYWKAQCITRGKHYGGILDRVPCRWGVSASCKNSLQMFRITKWAGSHNCSTDVVANNNRCLTAGMIATEIQVQVQKKLTFPVRHIQTQIKQTWNVDVSYAKAWNARRIAIERLYGTWPSNFDALPKYIAELVRANPDTVVEWQHCPTSSSHIQTFMYVFWSFGPAIRAFQRCIPVVFVDGTHLKGSYKGKLLTAVTKNANGQILPIAYALVDDETNESWAWFLQHFQTHIGSQRAVELCIISDRHQGIINAVSNMAGWHHRYCLRHICSNVQSKFKNRRIKNLCWVVGSTSQASKYTWGVRQIKGEDPAAWAYLKDIGLEKWTLKHDVQHRRWGNLTTNVVESMNNVLGLARMLPIRALIDYTFDYTRGHFVKQHRLANNWNPPLARQMWKVFQKRERASTAHTVQVYDERHGLYTVRAHERNGNGEYTYTVTFGQSKKCSCGNWQNHRFPCSHGIAVCGYRQEQATGLVSKRYTTRTWQHQYDAALAPLRDFRYWGEVDWMIQGDPLKLVTHRGRRRTRQYHNEMDESASTSTAKARQPGRCGICNGLGHNRRNCNQQNE